MHKYNLSKEIDIISEPSLIMMNEIIDLKKTKKPKIYMENGNSTAILLDFEYFNELIDRNELLEEIVLSEKQIESGDYFTNEEAKAVFL